MGATAANLEVGHQFTTARRTITEADIVNFAGLSNDFDPLHIDQIYAEENEFGRRIAHGQMIASVVTGLRSELDEWPVVAYVEASRTFQAPVGVDDTIHARYVVESSRPTGSRPEVLVITLGVTVLTQDGTEAISGSDVMLVDTELEL